jgi:transcriptional regulator with XRE-family HTH domain
MSSIRLHIFPNYRKKISSKLRTIGVQCIRQEKELMNMTEQDIISRIKNLCQSRKWTVYRLSKESGITYSTLCTMLNKESAPSMGTLSKLCAGFGISMKQFFDLDDEAATLTAEQKRHLMLWGQLQPSNKKVVDKYIDFLLSEQGNC